MSSVALWGRPGRYPFAGYFRGELVDAGGRSVAWAGRVRGGGDLAAAFRGARAADRALRRAGPPSADRRRGLSILWTRLEAASAAVIGDELSLLLCARDEEGIAVSGVGLSGVWAASEDVPAAAWVGPAHPLLGPAGRPARLPGALTVADPPAWLLAAADDGVDLAGTPLRGALPRCGVHR